ncbi:class I SAM-dependent methyltransferase [Thermoproteota archaeon]
MDRFEAGIVFIEKLYKRGIIKGVKFLEIGGGNGLVALNIVKRLPKIDYTVSEYSKRRYELLRERLKEMGKLHAALLDIENVTTSPFYRDNKGSFDCVILIAVLEHLRDPMQALQAIYELLKPGGVIYIDTPNIGKYTHRLKALYGLAPTTASRKEGLKTFDGANTQLLDEGHYHYFTYNKLNLLLLRVGFTKTVYLGYPGGKQVFGKFIHTLLAKLLPKLFSELVMIGIK